MKKLLPILFILISLTAFSQSKKDIITKKWKIHKTEEFGQEYDPLDEQKGDWMQFTDNGKFTGIIEGNHVEGTWSATNSVTVKVDKANSKTKINWTKVKTAEKDKFALEYQNGDLITSILIFIPAE